MRIKICDISPGAERWLPENEADASGIGINYADAILKPFKTTLEDGRKVTCKRRGLQLTLKVGDRRGKGLMRRLEHGPDVRAILQFALAEAAAQLDASCSIDDDAIWLDLPD